MKLVVEVNTQIKSFVFKKGEVVSKEMIEAVGMNRIQELVDAGFVKKVSDAKPEAEDKPESEVKPELMPEAKVAMKKEQAKAESKKAEKAE